MTAAVDDAANECQEQKYNLPPLTDAICSSPCGQSVLLQHQAVGGLQASNRSAMPVQGPKSTIATAWQSI